MRYLCAYHVKQIAQNPPAAMQLWEGAMENGHRAWGRDEQEAARNFFGAAYETALLYLSRDNDTAHRFTTDHLLRAGRALGDVLEGLGLWQDAHGCWLTLQNFLSLEVRQHEPSMVVEKTRALVDELASDFAGGGAQAEIPNDQAARTKSSNPSLDVLMGSLCFLMTRYALQPSAHLAGAVADHFERLHQHPQCDSDTLLNVGRRLSRQWQHLASPGKPTRIEPGEVRVGPQRVH